MLVVRKHDVAYADATIDLVENEAPVWDVATTFNLNDEVIRDHKVFVSAIDGNLGLDPLNEDQSLVGVRWLLKGHTNAFQFLDGTISNRSVGATSVTITVDNLVGVNALVLFGLTGIDVSIEGETSAGTVIYQHAENISGRETNDWYDWFFDPFEEYSDKVVVSDIPAGVSKLTIIVTGAVVEIGELVVGHTIDIGAALFDGTEGEAISYTKTEFNAYGVLTNIKRPVRNEMRYSVHVGAGRFRSIKPLMDRMQGDLVAAIGSAARPSTVHLGILGTVKWSEKLPNDYILQFTLRGVS